MHTHTHTHTYIYIHIYIYIYSVLRLTLHKGTVAGASNGGPAVDQLVDEDMLHLAASLPCHGVACWGRHLVCPI